MKYSFDPLDPKNPRKSVLVDDEGCTIAVLSTPNENAEQVAQKIIRTQNCLRDAILVIEDFMPNIGRCVLQDYGRLNDVLCLSRELLKE